MTATNEQLARVKSLSECQVLLPDRREALAAVLEELTAGRGLRDAVRGWIHGPSCSDVAPEYTRMIAALDACQGKDGGA